MAKLKGQLFARLALDYFDHPKIMRLSSDAIVAHLEMIVYSRKYQTDGAIPMRFAMRFAKDVLSELASNDEKSPSVILNDDGSLTIHGFADMQETEEQIAERRQVRSAAGRKGANARWQTGGKPHGKSHSKSHDFATENDGKKMAETETETDITSGSSNEELRPDMQAILDCLDAHLDNNNLKRPNRTQGNLRAARLLLDRDGHSVEDVKRIIDFAQTNEFWIPNIRSMSKLREKWDQLSAQSGRGVGPKPFDLWSAGGPI